MVLNATFNNIQLRLYRGGLFYWWRKPEYPEKEQPYNRGTTVSHCKTALKILCHIAKNIQFNYFSELEWKLSVVGALKTDLEEPPKKQISDAMDRAMKQNTINDSDDDNDW